MKDMVSSRDAFGVSSFWGCAHGPVESGPRRHRGQTIVSDRGWSIEL